MSKIQYLQYEPGAFARDGEWIMMLPVDRNIYHTLIIYLSCNEGSLSEKLQGLAAMCNVDIDAMQSFMDQYAHKFQFSDGRIFHAKVTDQIKRAKEFREARARGGRTSRRVK